MFVRNAHGKYTTPEITNKYYFCCVKGCLNPAEDRAHVRICNQFGKIRNMTVYVVPMCTKHNRSKGDAPLEIRDNTILVKIN